MYNLEQLRLRCLKILSQETQTFACSTPFSSWRIVSRLLRNRQAAPWYLIFYDRWRKVCSTMMESIDNISINWADVVAPIEVVTCVQNFGFKGSSIKEFSGNSSKIDWRWNIRCLLSSEKARTFRLWFAERNRSVCFETYLLRLLEFKIISKLFYKKNSEKSIY